MCIRWCDDIGMYALDRPRSSSCVHRTEFCEKTCYNEKLEKAFPKIHERDVRNEIFWESTDGPTMKMILSKKTKKTKHKRIRLCTRGEPIASFEDVWRIYSWAKHCEDWTWWIPTRSWRNGFLWSVVLDVLSGLKNVRLMASVDPSNTPDELWGLEDYDVPMLFYGAEEAPVWFSWFKCPKTFQKVKGHCGVCKAGCFSRTTHVHLKQH